MSPRPRRMSPLVACPSCHRHVRCAEAECPFCTASIPTDLAETLVPLPQERRGARVVLAPAMIAALAVGAFDCAFATKYGGPPIPADDAGASAPPPAPPPPAPAPMVPAYGAPPVATPVATPPSDAAAGPTKPTPARQRKR